MHIVLGHVGEFKVDHMRQFIDIQATCCNVGGNQHTHVTGLETGQCTGTRPLALVAVNGGGGQAVLFKMLGQAVGAVLGAGENQHLLPVVGAHQVREQRRLALFVHAHHFLCNGFGRRVSSRHLDRHRVIQQLVGQVFDLIREGRGKQQVLALLWQQGQHLLDIVDKAHVEHAVGLVEDQHFHVIQFEGALPHVIEQATRRGDQYIDAFLERADLRVDLHPAENDRGFQIQVFTVGLHRLADLCGQFPGRGQHQCADTVGLGCLGLCIQHVQQRQREARSFTGTGLRACKHVFAFEDNRNRLGLDGGRSGIAFFNYCTQDFGRQAELLKIHIW